MMLGTLVVLTLVGSLVLTAARFVHTGVRWPILLASFSPYALVGFLLVLTVCALKVRAAGNPWWVWPGLVLAAVGLVAQVWWLGPQFAGGDRAARSDLTVMTSNLSFGRGDSATVVRTVGTRQVDVLVLQEVTPSSLRALRGAGLPELLPHQRGVPDERAAGTMVFSRYPLGKATVFPLGNVGLDVRVRAPEPFRLLAVHTAQPVRTPLPWLVDMQLVHRLARAAVDQDPTLVVGDFNATRDHEPMRRVLDLGLRDAAEESGSGWQPTWPTRYRDGWLRPLIAIDHVLSTDDFEAVGTRTVEVPHTDHLSVVARLRFAKAD
jgi:endonuclease/exonuclease/phosphatase family metal-dependent hydrolase